MAMTVDQVMMGRVEGQLRSRPPGWLGTAAEIAAQMVSAEPRAVEDACRVLYLQDKLQRAGEPGSRSPCQYGVQA